jgi:hypothetical protein
VVTVYEPSGFSKPELEFFDPTSADAFAWTPVAGDVTGQLAEMILSGSHESGWVSRLLRFQPGCDTTANGTLTHDVWEEVWIVSGEIRDLRLGRTFTAGMYACRPPGMEHGPWTSVPGAVTFETRFPEPRHYSARP